jgi:hypothetical protein
MRALIVLAALIAGLAAAAQAVIGLRTRSGWRELRAGMRADLERGGLHALQRARLVAVRLAVAEPEDASTAALQAYLCARLSAGYGLPFERQAEEAAARAERAGAAGADAARVAAARALLHLQRGDRAAALALATAAADGTAVGPFLALALARSRSGDGAGASRALEAAQVVGPESGEARLAWAEVRIDHGGAAAALPLLERFVGAVPADTEAQLLRAQALEQLGRSMDQSQARALAESCARDGKTAPRLLAACALEEAGRARHGGDGAAALERARRAAQAADPRLLGRAAQLLAQLGHVDEAEAVLARARRLADPTVPALAWAGLAVALGRGQVAVPPPDLATTGALDRLIAARSAFAAGGQRGLEAWMSAGPPTSDPELHLLRSFLLPGFTQHARTPMGAYLSGLRARLDGDLPAAARLLGEALDGHADACRAAGEYAATQVALGQAVDPVMLRPLQEINSRCVNLDPAGLAPPKRRR